MIAPEEFVQALQTKNNKYSVTILKHFLYLTYVKDNILNLALSEF